MTHVPLDTHAPGGLLYCTVKIAVVGADVVGLEVGPVGAGVGDVVGALVGGNVKDRSPQRVNPLPIMVLSVFQLMIVFAGMI